MHVCLNVGPSKVNQEEEEEVHGHWPDVNGWMDGPIDRCGGYRRWLQGSFASVPCATCKKLDQI